MNFRARTAILSAACWLGVGSLAWGQTPASLDSLRRSVGAVSARIDSLEAGLCPAEATASPSKPSGNAPADSLAATIERLNRRVEALRSVQCAPGTAGQPAAPQLATPAQQVPPARTGGAYMNIGFVSLTDLGWSTEPDVGSLQLGDHDPLVRGFTLPNSEISLDGAVDPYFKGFSSIVLKLDAQGETGIELEEVYFLTTSLPGTSRLKAGSFSRSSAARICSTRTRGPLWTSRWYSIACSAPRGSGVKAPGSPGSRQHHGTPRPWWAFSTVLVAQPSAFARTSHQKFTGAYPPSVTCAACRTCCWCLVSPCRST